MGNRIGTTPSSPSSNSGVDPATPATDSAPSTGPVQEGAPPAGTDTPPVEGQNVAGEGQNEIEDATRPDSPTTTSPADSEEPLNVGDSTTEVDEPEATLEDRPEYDSQHSRRDQLFNDFNKAKAKILAEKAPDQQPTAETLQEFTAASDALLDMQESTQDFYESREKNQDEQQKLMRRREQTLTEQQSHDVKRGFQQLKAKSSQWLKTVKSEQNKEAMLKFHKNISESQRRQVLVDAKRNHQKHQEKLTVWNQLVQTSAQRAETKKQKLNLKERLKYEKEAKETGADEGVEGDGKLTKDDRVQIKKEAETKRKAELARIRGIAKPEDEIKAEKKREQQIKKELADLHDGHVKDPTKAQLRGTIAALKHAKKLTEEQANDLLQKLEESVEQAAERIQAGAGAMVARKDRGLVALLGRAGRLIHKGKVGSDKAREDGESEDETTVRYVFTRAWEIFSKAGSTQAETNIESGGGANLSTTSTATFEDGQEKGQLAYSRVMKERPTAFDPTVGKFFTNWQRGPLTASRLRNLETDRA